LHVLSLILSIKYTKRVTSMDVNLYLLTVISVGIICSRLWVRIFFLHGDRDARRKVLPKTPWSGNQGSTPRLVVSSTPIILIICPLLLDRFLNILDYHHHQLYNYLYLNFSIIMHAKFLFSFFFVLTLLHQGFCIFILLMKQDVLLKKKLIYPIYMCIF
jgi:hypothetical protein